MSRRKDHVWPCNALRHDRRICDNMHSMSGQWSSMRYQPEIGRKKKGRSLNRSTLNFL